MIYIPPDTHIFFNSYENTHNHNAFHNTLPLCDPIVSMYDVKHSAGSPQIRYTIRIPIQNMRLVYSYIRENYPILCSVFVLQHYAILQDNQLF